MFFCGKKLLLKYERKDFIKKLLQDGWELDRVKGSHHIMRKDGINLSVPVHGSANLKPGILNFLNKKAGYKK